jgi:hypothetical protein
MKTNEDVVGGEKVCTSSKIPQSRISWSSAIVHASQVSPVCHPSRSKSCSCQFTLHLDVSADHGDMFRVTSFSSGHILAFHKHLFVDSITTTAADARMTCIELELQLRTLGRAPVGEAGQ